MASIRTSVPFPTQPWEAAKRRFLEGLSLGERDRFQNATAENVFYDASASQKKHAQGSKSWLVHEKLSSLTDGIEDYGKALDVFSNTYGLILCPLWGSVRVVLQIAREAGRFQENVVDMLSRIGDALPRFQIYQVLFRNHERLLAALSVAYLDMISFCIRLKDFFLEAKKKLLPLSVTCMALWKPFRKEFDDYMVGFRKHQKRVEKEAGLAHMIEAAKTREIEKANRQLQKHNDRINKRHKFLASLNTVSYEAQHHKTFRQRYTGTLSWIPAHPRYTDWLGTPSSECLCCFGIPGSGKSVVASTVVDELYQAYQGPRTLICYYYCNYKDTSSLDPSFLVGSLIKQALVHIPLEDSDYLYDTTATEHSPIDRQNLLLRLFRHYSKVFVVLDGIDELNREGQTVVLDLINLWTLTSQPVMKIFVTSRTEDFGVRDRLKSHKSFDILGSNVEEDIIAYIEGTLRQTALQNNPVLANAGLRQKIADALVYGAKGMFLWVKLQLYEIQEALTEDTVRQALRNLPRDLRETYSRITQKTFDSPGGSAKFELMKSALRWICCARRPLLLRELEEAVGLDKKDKFLHTERTASNAGDRLISVCGNLVTYDRDDGTVTLVHPTVQQYLWKTPTISHWNYPSTIHFDPGAAELEIGEICIAYLSFADFETQLVNTQKPAAMKRGVAERLIWDQVPFGSRIRNLVAPPTKTSTPQVELTFPIQKATPPALTKKYMLLEYIVEYWAFHAASFSESNIECWNEFAEVVFLKQMVFEFRPWNTTTVLEKIGKIDGYDKNWKCLYSWTVDHGLISFLRLLHAHDTTTHLFHEHQIDSMKCRPSQCLYLSVANLPLPSVSRGTFWSGDLIYQGVRLSRVSAHLLQDFLQLVHREIHKHSQSDPALRMRSMFEDSIEVALQAGDIGTFQTLIKPHGRSYSWEELIRAIISLSTKNCPNHGLAMLSLLSMPMARDRPWYTPDLELLVALEKKFTAIVTAIHEEKLGRDTSMFTRNVSPEFGWLLIFIATSRDAPMDVRLLPFVLDAFRGQWYGDKEVYLYMPEWDYAGLVSGETVARLQAVQDRTLFGVLVHEAKRAWSLDSTTKQTKFEYLSTVELLSSWLSNAKLVKLESQGVHLLSWAAEMGMTSVVRTLMSHTYYIRNDDDNIVWAANALSAAAKHSPQCLRIMLEWSWSASKIRRFKDESGWEPFPLDMRELLLKVKQRGLRN